MKFVLLALIGLGCLPGWPALAEPFSPYAAHLDWNRDLVVERVVVPSAERPQGEVQLIQRGELLVVRTLLASRTLKRVVAVIDGKEKSRWPEGSAGHGESIRYREELLRATERSWAAFRQRGDRQQDRQTLAIEFILGPRLALIALSLPQLAENEGHLRVIGQEPITVWRGAREYVQENIFVIVKDSFQLDDDAAAELLKPFWPGVEKTSPD